MGRTMMVAVGFTLGVAAGYVATGWAQVQAPAAAAVPDAATDRTQYWTASDIQARWARNEAQRVINSRLFNGPRNISANVRIVLPNDEPLVHETTADLWIVTAGTATAVTDGTMGTAGGTASIVNPTRRPVQSGDILYVPPGVPHHFLEPKGFRAYLIRFDVK